MPHLPEVLTSYTKSPLPYWKSPGQRDHAWSEPGSVECRKPSPVVPYILTLCESSQGFSFIPNPWGQGTLSKLPGALVPLNTRYTFCSEHLTCNNSLNSYIIILILFDSLENQGPERFSETQRKTQGGQLRAETHPRGWLRKPYFNHPSFLREENQWGSMSPLAQAGSPVPLQQKSA